MDDSEVFLKAIDVLERVGWHQGGLYDRLHYPSAVCLVGALRVAALGVDGLWNTEVLPGEVLFGAMLAVGVLTANDLGGWNDAPERTYEDVVLALKRAAHGEVA